MKRPKRGEFYRHFKGNTYYIVGLSRHTETGEILVTYKSFKEPDQIPHSRPLEQFMDIHPEHKVKRFEKVEIE
ncbi:DUF1653 domain-containing protein [Alteribacillus sp. YIM 98480]|uniref:DUF1653 domain-containing protein n=1 Tax=Alteribacillus sp. YIM 98480 TaxID=2606599 RepID=UPI0018EEF17A|nr:DUF1653 domain-containing protein [Alteribacillus sp. YIM 98480]